MTGDPVLVTGPWLAGVTSLATALREHVPEHAFVDTVGDGVVPVPVAVVFAVSAVAPLTRSDCALLDAAAARTDLVVAAVSKVDMHRNWRDVLAADRQILAAHDSRYRDVEWVGTAAAPELGDPQLDELVDVLRRELAHADHAGRNRLRAKHTQLQTVVRKRDARMTVLREQRSEAVRQRRLAKSERTIGLRSQIQQARVQLTYFARHRCSSMRAELAEDAAVVTRRRLGAFEEYVRRRVAEVIEDVHVGVTEHISDVASELGLTAPDPDVEAPPRRPAVSAPPAQSRRLETRLMMVLGAGFGLGMALTLSRLFAGVASGYTAVGLVGGAALGLLVTVWVVGTRGLLHDRAVLDRWVSDVVTDLRAVVDELVAARVLRAEALLTAEQVELDNSEAASLADKLAALDAELREHALAVAQAVAAREG